MTRYETQLLLRECEAAGIELPERLSHQVLQQVGDLAGRASNDIAVSFDYHTETVIEVCLSIKVRNEPRPDGCTELAMAAVRADAASMPPVIKFI